MPEVDPLVLELRADVRSFSNDLNQAQRVSEMRLSAIEARSVKMGEGVRAGFGIAKTAAIGFIASVGIGALTGAIKEGLQYASTLGETAQQLGVTTRALQEYRYAGSQAGLATEETDQALSQLTRRIGEAASGTKAQSEAFEKLGVSVKTAEGGILDAGDAIPLIADALQKIESPAERAAILMDLFGRSGQKLEPLLAGGAAGVNQLRDAANKLGIVLSDSQINKADETADKLDALKQVLSAKISGAVSDNADAILILADALVTLVGNIGSAVTATNKLYNSLKRDFSSGNLFGADFVEGIVGPRNTGAPLSRDARRGRAEVAAQRRRGFNESYFGNQPQSLLLRNNFSAQSNPIEDFRNSLNAPQTAALSLGPTQDQANSISLSLNESQRELLSVFLNLSDVAADLVDTVEARVANEKVQIEADKIQAIDRINASTALTDAQKQLAAAGLEAVAQGRIELADAKLAADIAARKREADNELADIAEQEKNLAVENLKVAYDSATSQSSRREIALKIIDAEIDYLKSIQQSVIDSKTVTDAQRQIAELKIQQLDAERAGRVNQSNQNNAGALDQYLAEINSINFGDQAEAFGVDAIKELNAGLSEAIVNGGNLGDVLEDTGKRFIKQLLDIAFQLLVIKPLLQALGESGAGGGGSSGGGGFKIDPSSLLSLFGAPKASGGPVTAGKLFRVNETQQEFFQPAQNGKIITMGQMQNKLAQGGSNGGGGVSIIRVQLSGDMEAKMVETARGVSVEVTRQFAPSIVNAGAAKALRDSARGRI
jgi:hypothetical protein